MNKKLLIITLIPLIISVIFPAMAIGPQKAEKNPHIMFPTEGGVELLTPSGVDHTWVPNREIYVMDFEHILDASKAKIRNAYPLTLATLQEIMIDPDVALQYENKWGYMSNAVLEGFFEWLINMGYPITPQEMALILSMYPEGIYIMFVNVGK